jgi:hypothetical protein
MCLKCKNCNNEGLISFDNLILLHGFYFGTDIFDPFKSKIEIFCLVCHTSQIVNILELFGDYNVRENETRIGKIRTTIFE